MFHGEYGKYTYQLFRRNFNKEYKDSLTITHREGRSSLSLINHIMLCNTKFKKVH